MKQSPRAKFDRLCLATFRFSFKQSNVDHILFVKWKGGHVTILLGYVDDMVVTGDAEGEF